MPRTHVFLRRVSGHEYVHESCAFVLAEFMCVGMSLNVHMQVRVRLYVCARSCICAKYVLHCCVGEIHKAHRTANNSNNNKKKRRVQNKIKTKYEYEINERK